jgi:hypothetical protein
MLKATTPQEDQVVLGDVEISSNFPQKQHGII